MFDKRVDYTTASWYLTFCAKTNSELLESCMAGNSCKLSGCQAVPIPIAVLVLYGLHDIGKGPRL